VLTRRSLSFAWKQLRVCVLLQSQIASARTDDSLFFLCVLTSDARVFSLRTSCISSLLLPFCLFLLFSQDLYQYLTNGHPLFGICLHHRLHPVGWGLRLAALIGSIAFGLAITNCIYLLFVLEDQDFDESYYEFALNQTVTGNSMVDESLTQVNVTSGMIALWTVGSAMNALYDMTIWTIASCQCFNKGGKLEGGARLRSYLIIGIILIVVTGSTLAVLVRATYDANKNQAEMASKLEISYTPNAESYRFLIAYSAELVFSLFVWHPIIGCLLFTGVLGCKKVPVLGGRPAEMKTLECKQQRESLKTSAKSSV
jgi:hypothetical protein